MWEVRTVRRFEGRKYRLDHWFETKAAAKQHAENKRRKRFLARVVPAPATLQAKTKWISLKARGHLVRITLRPESKVRGGYPLMDLWYIWKRKP